MPTLQYIPVPLNPQESVSALQGILPLLCISYILIWYFYYNIFSVNMIK